MAPHNNFSDTKLAIEPNSHENASPNVEDIENSTSARNAKEISASNAAQDTPPLQHDYDTVLDMIGYGRTQWLLLITCGLLLMMVINETMGMSIVTLASQCDFATTSVDKAIMSAASFVGIALFSYVWGYLSDTTGRRRILLFATFGGCLCSLISMFMPSFWYFVFMRFVVGCFIAGPSSTTYAFLGEFHARRHNALAMNYASLFVGVGMTYVPAIAWLVLSMDWSLQLSDSFAFRPWRLMMIVNLLPGLIAACILLMLPESPKLLLSLRKDEEALAAANWICECNTGKDLKQLGVNKLKAERTMAADKVHITSKSCFQTVKHIWQETRPLVHRPYVLNFLISCVTMCGLFFSSSGMGLWFPEIQNRLSMTTAENHETICQIIGDTFNDRNDLTNTTKVCVDEISDKSYIDSISMGLAYVVGYILIGGVIKLFGRKATIIGSLLLSAVCCVTLFWLLNPTAIVVSFIVFLTMPGLCISMLGSGVVELVPTHLRGKAVCICLLLGRTGSVFGSNLIGVLLESNCHLTFGLFTGCVLVCMLLTMTLPI
ncbi:synaptic vesicle glycoprotein 2B-like [Bactrocera neohumeralis]|uniref:synaptic vesicle glycoprotein 2B-like n=1 Tax=Bactrocera neohumeralis TaxID=98809 RepID=UPI0021657B6B|nr:synaptic vesicle glycoprotein 2B-like [Bactrocera neohumeralis]